MQKIPIKDATDLQLRAWATEALGLQIAHNASREKIAAAILQADQAGEIFIETPQAPPAPDSMDPMMNYVGPSQIKPLMGKGAAYKSDPHVVLVLNRTEEHGGDEPLPLSVNGKRFDIPRGVPVVIPWRYFLNLRQCIKTVYHQVSDNEVLGRDVQAYPFNVLVWPSREEVINWHTKDAAGPNAHAAA